MVELLEEALKQLPGTMLVRISQGRALGGVGQTQVTQLAFASGQAPADFAQRVRLPQLAKQHGDELAPAGEAARVPLGSVLPHQLLEFQTRKQLE